MFTSEAPSSQRDPEGTEHPAIVRFDELSLLSIIARMSADDIYEVQRLYPQIFLACHTNHVRAATTRW
ncbi:MAG TPA: hypothetical protein VIT19_02545, partial [Pyrinomonadaceae bacterium]